MATTIALTKPTDTRTAGDDTDDMPSAGTAFLAFLATIAAIVNVFMQGWTPAILHVIYGLVVLFVFRWAFQAHFAPRAAQRLDADSRGSTDPA